MEIFPIILFPDISRSVWFHYFGSSLALSIFFLLLLVCPNVSHSADRFSLLKESVLKVASDAPTVVFDPTRVTQVSSRPRAFLYKNFLADEECDHLIDLAKGNLKKSMVVDNKSGKSVGSEGRTSSGMFLSRHQDDIVSRIEARIAAWTFLPEENGEAMQILHYEHCQKYEPHFDFIHDKVNQERGGHRTSTVLMYLSNVEEGGETIFPDSMAAQVKGENWSECARNGYAVKPVKGDALLFFSRHPNATTDNLSLHGSCPVIEGEKWSATKWIQSYGCIDKNKYCPSWAAAGECQNNPGYMVGSKDYMGFCRKSCKVC